MAYSSLPTATSAGWTLSSEGGDDSVGGWVVWRVEGGVLKGGERMEGRIEHAIICM